MDTSLMHNISRLYFTILLIFQCFSLPLLGQHYIAHTQSFGLEDGLSARLATCFLKDDKGFMWIGTQHGLNRFDGYQFKAYTKESHGLQFNHIHQLARDDDGYLWILYTKGFDLSVDMEAFDPSTEQVIPLTDLLTNTPFATEHVAHLNWSSQHGVIITLRNGDIYTYRLRKIRKLASVPSEKGNDIQAFYPLKTGGGWLLSSFELNKISTNGAILETIKTQGRTGEILSIDANDQPIYTYFDPNIKGITILRAGRQTLLQMPLYTEAIIGIDKFSNKVYAVKNAPNSSELVVFDTLGNLLQTATDELQFHADSLQLFTPEICHYKRSGGFMLVQTAPTKFNKYMHHVTNSHGYSFGARSMIQLNDSTLLANGGSYTYTIDLKTGKHKPLTPNLPKYKKGFNQSLHAFKDHRGDIWLSNETTHLLRYTPTTQHFQLYHYGDSIEKRLAGNYHQTVLNVKPLLQWGLFEDKHHKIWIGHQNGLSFLDQETQQLKVFTNYHDFNQLQQSTVYHFHENAKGVWLATTSGIYLFDPTGKGQILAQHHENGSDTFHLPHNHIAHIHEDSTGIFWLASKGGGLIKWNPTTGKSQQFTTANGLSNNVIYAVYGDDYNNLWISSNKGIMRFNKETLQISTYLPKDGITHEEFNTISHYQAPDGTIYFGGLNGITSFHPKQFIDHSKNLVHIQVSNVFKRNGETGELINITQATLNTNEIRLEPSDLGFELNFANLNFKSQGAMYAYQIADLDANWHYTNQPKVAINYLPSGNYKLHVKVQGSQGNWSETAIISIDQLSPFYRQQWFFACVASFTLLLGWAFLKYRTYKHQQKQRELESIIQERTEIISKQNEELQSLDKLKSKFFANISHELRTPLTLILGPTTLLQQTHQDAQSQKLLGNIRKNGESLRNMINEILDLSKLDASKLVLHESEIQLRPFFQGVFERFESEALMEDITFKTIIELTENKPAWIDVEKTERIIINLLSNAFKYTPTGGEITAHTWMINGQLNLSIKDSGIGISKDDLPYIFDRYFQSNDPNKSTEGGTGIGLAFSKELVELMNGSLTVKSTRGIGSEFICTLPIQYQSTQKNGTEISISPINGAVAIPSKNGNKPTILLVEDNAEMRNFVSDLLIAECHVITSSNGAEALHLLKTSDHLPDFILTDAMMPKMNGFELLEKIRNNLDWKRIPTLMLTARTADEARIRAFTIGVNDYMNKPFSPQELKVRISNLLQYAYDREAFMNELIQHHTVSTTANSTNDSQQMTIAESEWEWIAAIEKSIRSQINANSFSLKTIASQQGISERQFQRKVKQITGLTPVKYQQEIQLHIGRELLELKKTKTVKEAALSAGFKDSHYFSTLYAKRFGKRPSEYLA